MPEVDLKSIAENMLSIMRLINKKILKCGAHVNNKNIAPTSQFIMLLLNEHGMLPISELGNQLKISKPNMSHLIDRLHSDGYVERIPDKNDRRIININLTDSGRKIIEEQMIHMISVLKLRLSSLSEENLIVLFESLNNVNNIIMKMD